MENLLNSPLQSIVPAEPRTPGLAHTRRRTEPRRRIGRWL